METRLRNFMGRTELLAQLHHYIEDPDYRVPLGIIGTPGSGKSALMGCFSKQCMEKYREAIVIPHFVGGTPKSTNIR